jgi:hypothetical protein
MGTGVKYFGFMIENPELLTVTFYDKVTPYYIAGRACQKDVFA